MLKWINKKRNKKGFTLVELVVVIAILGILAAIAIPKLGKSRDTAEKAKHDSNARILKSAAMMYLADNPNNYSKENLLGKDGPLLAYLDSGKPPVAYKGGTFVVTIDTSGDIKVVPDEGVYETDVSGGDTDGD